MRTRQVTLDTDDLNLNYEESLTMEIVEDFILEDLDVPSEYIESLSFHDEHFVDINLNYTKAYLNDDWYINIKRIA